MRDLVGYLSPSIVYSEGKYKLWAIEHLPQEEKVHWPIRKARMVIHGPRSKNALSEAIME